LQKIWRQIFFFISSPYTLPLGFFWCWVKECHCPPLPEQRRIVAKIESLTAKIDEAKRLREEIQRDAQAMLRSAFQRIVEGAEYHPMAEVAPIVRRPVTIEPDGEYPELGVRSFGKGTFHKPVLNGIDVGTKKLYHIHPGDLVFSNVFAWEGAIAVVQPKDAGRVGSHRFITCVPESGVTTPEFLCFYLLTDEGIEQVRKASPGGAGRNRTLGLKKLEKIEVPIPHYDKQLWFNRLQAQAAFIRQAQSDNQTQLDALLPAILDRAFKGEL
jgi:type I restriction enzyme, S subunit